MTGTLSRLLRRLDRHSGAIPPDELRTAVADCGIQRSDLSGFVRFGRGCYRRNPVHTGPAYQALVLCWRSGQRSPIHDHRGSACALVVVEGTATETVFALSGSGLIFPTQSRRLEAGEYTASFDADIHQMGNLEAAGRDLITLHIYSPPLLHMGTYFLGDSVIGHGGELFEPQSRRSRRAAPDRHAPA